jgi:cytidylate kinase
MSKMYNPDYPIVVGLAGKAATGKTSVAETIVPKASFDKVRSGVYWDHIFFAMPLYELLSIRTKIEGANSQSRKLFAIHETLYDLYGNSTLGDMPNYYSFISLVDNINREPIDLNGAKPRSFLQKAGDLCRAHDPKCFAKWGVRKAYELRRDYVKSLEEDETPNPYCVLVSDVRFENEAESILKLPNSMLILFEASDEVRRERVFSRDGVYMTDEQLSHKSEKEIDNFTHLVDATIDSSSMSVEDQAVKTITLIKEKFGLVSYAQDK